MNVIAIPFQRLCADVNSPYKLITELTQLALYINHYSEAISHTVIAMTVEGLYCKRPIQCLASSEILTPRPLTARRVCTLPRLWCGGRTHSLGGEGVGGQ
jgi:hypothetical protein